MEIPGFVDLQVNGYKGIDFSSRDLTEDHFLFACKELLNQGTVAFLPTIITSSVNIYKRNLKLIAKSIKHKNLKEHVLGIHIEGPFISEKEGAVGAHNPEWVQKPNIKFLDKLYAWSGENIKLLTMAAEISDADILCEYATTLGITVSLGHQMATETDLEKLAGARARGLTHLGKRYP